MSTVLLAKLCVADLGERLHLVTYGRSLCGRRVDPRDIYEPEAGWRAWEDRAGDRCRKCEPRLEGSP